MDLQITTDELFHPLLNAEPSTRKLLESLPQLLPHPANQPDDPLACKVAADLLQRLPKEFQEEEGMKHLLEEEGKMFGILLVQSPEGVVGYLMGFSGKLLGKTQWPGFVPPVYDLQGKGSFYPEEEAEIDKINQELESVEQSEAYKQAAELYENTLRLADGAIADAKARAKSAKQQRKQERNRIHSENPIDRTSLAKLDQQSAQEHFHLKDLKRHWESKIQSALASKTRLQAKIEKLQLLRQTASRKLQKKVFDQYTFLNCRGESKSLWEIFVKDDNSWPPTGAGECAGPKLFQAAFLLGLKPLSLAEIWFGAPLASEVRHHGHFYPACRGKCLPIFEHMLKGLDLGAEISPEPMEQAYNILFEDDALLAIDKPPGVLSVPGRRHKDSVATWVKENYPEIQSPLILHRLDMATSGILLFAKTSQAYHYLQKQFMAHSIQKTYTAVLCALPKESEGLIDLPLMPDWERRPAQKVDYQKGKPARTRYRVLGSKGTECLVHFFPETGRTHQLRVHASHPSGLDAPIKGDKIYGRGGKRLHLHAAKMQFLHPLTGRQFKIISPSPFTLFSLE